MSQDRIKVRTSIPSLQDKVQINIKGPMDTIYWYIRFNIELDEESVSNKTMNITDTDGYIMRTVISYRPKHKIIAVSPLDTYEENRFYLLNISKQVRSAKGQHLRSTIHILFKLIGGKVSDFKVLDKNVKVPVPQPRPADYDLKYQSITQQQSTQNQNTQQQNPQQHYTPNHFEQEYIDKSPPGKMASLGFFINPAFGFLGLIIVGVGAFLFNPPAIIAGVLVCLVGVGHIVTQLKDPELRSTLMFNKGVRLFNRERYRAAEKSFKRALSINPKNELAQHGMRKAKTYLGE